MRGPVEERPALAAGLATELGRRDRECWRSLTRALVDLGEASREPLDRVGTTGAFSERAQALATLLILDALQRDFRAAVEEAQRAALEVGTAADDGDS